MNNAKHILRWRIDLYVSAMKGLEERQFETLMAAGKAIASFPQCFLEWEPFERDCCILCKEFWLPLYNQRGSYDQP
ncbi:14830_t:CDS:2, partial [Acaulospora morrowiae]